MSRLSPVLICIAVLLFSFFIVSFCDECDSSSGHVTCVIYVNPSSSTPAPTCGSSAATACSSIGAALAHSCYYTRLILANGVYDVCKINVNVSDHLCFVGQGDGSLLQCISSAPSPPSPSPPAPWVSITNNSLIFFSSLKIDLSNPAVHLTHLVEWNAIPQYIGHKGLHLVNTTLIYSGELFLGFPNPPYEQHTAISVRMFQWNLIDCVVVGNGLRISDPSSNVNHSMKIRLESSHFSVIRIHDTNFGALDVDFSENVLDMTHSPQQLVISSCNFTLSVDMIPPLKIYENLHRESVNRVIIVENSEFFSSAGVQPPSAGGCAYISAYKLSPLRAFQSNLIGNKFHGCLAGIQGGAIDMEGMVNVSIIDNLFENCEITRRWNRVGVGAGGAIFIESDFNNTVHHGRAEFVLKGNTFIGNSVLANSKKLSAGGALYIYHQGNDPGEQTSSTLISANNVFLGNSIDIPISRLEEITNAVGGAVYAHVGYYSSNNDSFIGNSIHGQDGMFDDLIRDGGDVSAGALCLQSLQSRFIDVTFQKNKIFGGTGSNSSLADPDLNNPSSGAGGKAYGGALALQIQLQSMFSNATFIGCNFDENLAQGGDGGDVLRGVAAGGGKATGGGIYSGIVMVDMEVSKNQFIGNVAKGGCGGNILASTGESWNVVGSGADASGGAIFAPLRKVVGFSKFVNNSALGGDAGHNPIPCAKSHGTIPEIAGDAKGGAIYDDLRVIFSMKPTEIRGMHGRNNYAIGGNCLNCSDASGGGHGGNANGGMLFVTAGSLSISSMKVSLVSAENCFAIGGDSGISSDALNPVSGGEAFGGGMVFMTAFEMTNSQFLFNTAIGGGFMRSNPRTQQGSRGISAGGGLAVLLPEFHVYVESTQFIGNTVGCGNDSLADSGKIFGAALYFKVTKIGPSDVYVQHCLFNHNYIDTQIPCGAAIAALFEHNHQLSVERSFFYNNTLKGDHATGGAVYVVSSTVYPNLLGTVLIRNSFNSNNVSGVSCRGGALYVEDTMFLSSNNDYIGCSASGLMANGGTIALTGTTVKMKPCGMIEDHVYGSRISGAFSGGAAIAFIGTSRSLSGSSVHLNIHDSSFYNCKAETGAGGVVFLEGGLMESSLWAYRTSFIRNSAVDGGAVYMIGASAFHFIECDFDSNLATVNGGAVYLSGKNGIVKDCTFTHNSAVSSGGALYFFSNIDSGSIVEFNGNSYISNSARSGGAIAGLFGHSGDDGETSYLSFEGELIANNSAVFSSAGISLDCRNSNVSMKLANMSGNSSPQIPGALWSLTESTLLFQNNIVKNPMASSGSMYAQLMFIVYDNQSYVMDGGNSLYCDLGYNYTDTLAIDNNQNSSSIIVGCVPCPVETYLLDETGLPSPKYMECLPCPEHATCYGSSNIVPILGHTFIEYSKRNAYGQYQTTAMSKLCASGYCCQESGCCKNGGMDCCVEGRSGLVCGECDDGYCLSLEHVCVKCDECGSFLEVFRFFATNGVSILFVIIMRIAFPGHNGLIKVFDYFFSMLPISVDSARDPSQSQVSKGLKAIGGTVSALTNLQFLQRSVFQGSGHCPFRDISVFGLLALDFTSPFVYFLGFFMILLLHFTFSFQILLVKWIAVLILRICRYVLRGKRNERNSSSGHLLAWLESLLEDDDIENNSNNAVGSEDNDHVARSRAGDQATESLLQEQNNDSNAFESEVLNISKYGEDSNNNVTSKSVEMLVRNGSDDEDATTATVQSETFDALDEIAFEDRFKDGSKHGNDGVGVGVGVGGGGGDGGAQVYPLESLKFWKFSWLHSRRYCLAFLTILLESYRTFLTICLRYLECDSLVIGTEGHNELRLNWASSYQCYSVWQILLWIVLIFFLVPAPIYVVLIRFFMKALFASGKVKMGVKERAFVDMFEEAYHPRFKFWESVLLGRRLVLLMIVFATRNIEAR